MTSRYFYPSQYLFLSSQPYFVPHNKNPEADVYPNFTPFKKKPNALPPPLNDIYLVPSIPVHNSFHQPNQTQNSTNFWSNDHCSTQSIWTEKNWRATKFIFEFIFRGCGSERRVSRALKSVLDTRTRQRYKLKISVPGTKACVINTTRT